MACLIMLWHHMAAFHIETDCFPFFIVGNKNPLWKLCCTMVDIITSSWLDEIVSSVMYRIPTCLFMKSVTWNNVMEPGLYSAQLFSYIQCWRVLRVLIIDSIVDHNTIVLIGVCLDFTIPYSPLGLHVGCNMNHIIEMNHCRR